MQRLHNKAKRSGNSTHPTGVSFEQQESACIRILKLPCRNTNVSNFLGEAITKNPKRFWFYVKQLKKVDLGVANLDIEENVFSDGETKSDILKMKLSSMFTNESCSNLPSIGREPKPSISPLIITTTQTVTKQQTSPLLRVMKTP